MLAAVKAQVPFRINGRDVAVDRGTTTVRLHGETIAVLSLTEGKITIHAGTPVSRKSTRVFNALLKEYTDCRMTSTDGQWLLRLPSGRMEPLGTREVTIPFRKPDTKKKWQNL